MENKIFQPSKHSRTTTESGAIGGGALLNGAYVPIGEADENEESVHRALCALMSIGDRQNSNDIIFNNNQSQNPRLIFDVVRCTFENCAGACSKNSIFCRSHMGNKKCEVQECTKCAQGNTRLCIAHGGGRRCTYPDCKKGARDKLFCAAHGGGKRCNSTDCQKSAVGGSLYCTIHGGGRKCQQEGCSKSAQSPTPFCVRHGGGKKCSVSTCPKVARGKTLYCAGHGGGLRCNVPGCSKAAIAKENVCRQHKLMTDSLNACNTMSPQLQYRSSDNPHHLQPSSSSSSSSSPNRPYFTNGIGRVISDGHILNHNNGMMSISSKDNNDIQDQMMLCMPVNNNMTGTKRTRNGSNGDYIDNDFINNKDNGNDNDGNSDNDNSQDGSNGSSGDTTTTTTSNNRIGVYNEDNINKSIYTRNNNHTNENNNVLSLAPYMYFNTSNNSYIMNTTSSSTYCSSSTFNSNNVLMSLSNNNFTTIANNNVKLPSPLNGISIYNNSNNRNTGDSSCSSTVDDVRKQDTHCPASNVAYI